MKDENTLYWIWLSERCGIASKAFGRLAIRYDDPFELYRMEEEELEQLEGIGSALKSRLADKSLESAYASLRYCKENGVQILSYADGRYPARLRTIEDPPVLLYVLGRLPDLNRRLCVGMVGTRSMSEYGRQSAYKISYELAAAGAVIVSGMALGVDGVAACGALSGGGETVAVLGCGISVVYPKEHAHLMKEIAKSGAGLTEYPPNERPSGYHFPIRNRIISGLCQGVLVVEGAVGSGALITAKTAVHQGRELFALPGKINESNSEGPNELIRNGARVALSADDILRHYDFLYHDTLNYTALRKAKNNPKPEREALERYGVSARTMNFSSAATPVSEPSANRERKPKSEPKPKKISAPAQRSQDAPKADPTPAPASTLASGHMSEERIQQLLRAFDDQTRHVFEAMPSDRAITPDEVMVDGLGIGDTITALTLLELGGLVSSLPGGLYLKQ